MGTITALKVQPRKPRRVAVYVDGRMALEVSRPIAGGLRVGQTVDEAALADLGTREAVEAAVLRAGRLLSRRPRSESEVRTALRRAGVEPPAVEGAIDRLRQAGEIDDLRFANAWIDNRLAFRPRSAFALRTELQRKGVDRQVIEQALSGFSDEAAAFESARKAARRLHAREDQPLERQLYAYLQRRGFGHEVISAVVRRVVAGAAWSAEGEVEP